MSEDKQADEAPEAPPETPVRKRSEVFTALMRDRRLGHGAFHLWHCLYDYWDPKRQRCYPGQRAIATDIGCSHDSVKPWIAELVAAGWIRVDSTKNKQGSKRGERHSYILLDGQGEPLPKVGAVTVPKTGNTNHCSQNREHSAPKSRNTVYRKLGAEVITTRVRGASAARAPKVARADVPIKSFTSPASPVTGDPIETWG